MTYVRGNQVGVNHAGDIAFRVRPTAGEVLEDSSGIDEHTCSRTGGIHGVDEGSVERHAWGAAAEEQGVGLAGHERSVVHCGNLHALLYGKDGVVGIIY